MTELRATGVALLALMCCLSAQAAVRIDLNRDWQFRADPASSGEAAGWSSAIPADTEAVTLPHTWNIGKLHDYLGVAWYFRRFTLPPPAAATHVELHFGATFYSARVWLNGKELGRHEGGFTAYSFDIAPASSGSNVLAVRIDNRPGLATIPGFAERGSPAARYDWWTYGGLVRDVWLTTTGPAWVVRQQIRTAPTPGGAQVRDRISLGSSFAQPTPVTVRVTAFDPQNRVAASETRSMSVHRGAADVDVAMQLANPHLWNLDQPNLYRMTVELQDGKHALLDGNTAGFGVRTVKILDRHLLINGERVRLTGMARHEDSPWEGLKALSCLTTRTGMAFC
jgi:beta-galactosidase/beta-glucuronidase